MPPAASTVAPAPRARPPLQQALGSVLAQHPGTIGVVVKDLVTGQAVSFNPDRRFRSASLYKLFVMQTAAARIDAGQLAADETLTLSPELVADDPYADLPVGTQTSVSCALQTMLQMSGNSAADLLVERLGMQAINDEMASLGLTQSVIAEDRAFTSPADVALLLERLAAEPSSASSAWMLDMLAAQQHADRLPAPLPLGVRIAHKTGELPNLRNDAGIVYAPSGPYVFVALVQDAPSEAAARSAIVDLSRAAYDALEPRGVTLFRGLPPRLAREVFAVPNARGRLELLGDARTETVPLGPAGVHTSASSPGEARLRPELLPDLLALQAEALEAGVDLVVVDGWRAPSEAQANQAQPVAWLAPCAMQLPGPDDRHQQATPDQPPPDQPTPDQPPSVQLPPDQPPSLTQQWLGTVGVVESSDQAWLAAHAWEHGFVFAPPETEAGVALGYEPRALRWVGRDMAGDLHRRGISGRAVLGELARARAELDAQAAPADERRLVHTGLDAQSTPCWAAPDTTSQGCPARWYFSP